MALVSREMKQKLRDGILLSVGVLLISIAAKDIYDAQGLVTGGISGLSIVLHKLFSVPLWIGNAALNLPLFLIGFRVKGWHFLKRTLYATVLMTLLLLILPSCALVPPKDFFLGAVFGGILMGVGSGLVFISFATTGGTDLLAAIVQTRLRHYSIPQIMLIFDGLVVLIGIGTFGLSKALYAMVSVYIFSRISDAIIDGMHFAKAAFILSPKTREISQAVMTGLDRGTTLIHASGGYSGRETEMLYCVLSKREITILKDLVYDIDKKAFVIITDVREVHGEGFTIEKR